MRTLEEKLLLLALEERVVCWERKEKYWEAKDESG